MKNHRLSYQLISYLFAYDGQSDTTSNHLTLLNTCDCFILSAFDIKTNKIDSDNYECAPRTKLFYVLFK